MDCTFAAGCEKQAQRGGRLCSAHYRRRQRGKTSKAPIREQLSPFDALLRAVREFDECSAEDDAAFARASARLRMARGRYDRSVLDAANVVQSPAEGRRWKPIPFVAQSETSADGTPAEQAASEKRAANTVQLVRDSVAV